MFYFKMFLIELNETIQAYLLSFIKRKLIIREIILQVGNLFFPFIHTLSSRFNSQSRNEFVPMLVMQLEQFCFAASSYALLSAKHELKL